MTGELPPSASSTDATPDVAELFAEAQRRLGDRYPIDRVVAQSPRRALFLARDVVLKRRVALRVHMVPGERSREWFERETELLAALDHPSIRTIYGAGYVGDWAYRVAKWIEGESLADAVTREPRSIPFVLQLARDLTNVLEYAHSEQIVLRRIIPTTVMLDHANRAVITDLRYANRILKLADVDGPESDPFLAPETWHGHYGEPASDIYTVGALLYFALTGTPPATDPSRIVAPRQLRPTSPQTIDRVILRALRPDPNDRYLNAADMAQDLASDLGAFGSLPTAPPEGSSRDNAASWEKQLRRALGDQYELLEEIGAGGFGSVYRVRDLRLEREVAIKVLHPDLTTSPEVVERFRTEARLAAKLDHTNIVSIYSIESRAGLQMYSMEYVGGQNLGDRVRRTGPLGEAQWFTMMEQILAALSHAHSQGLVHRDLKPENILISERDGSIQITDFGLALALHGEGRRHAASHSGTPEYAAPEQLLGEAVDYRADLYAVSAVGYFALTGRPPVEGRTVEAVLARKAAGAFPAAPTDRPIPDAIVAVLARGAARDPHDRPATADAYWAALRGARPGRVRRWLKTVFGPRPIP